MYIRRYSRIKILEKTTLPQEGGNDLCITLSLTDRGDYYTIIVNEMLEDGEVREVARIGMRDSDTARTCYKELINEYK